MSFSIPFKGKAIPITNRKTLRHKKVPTDKEAYEICNSFAFVLDKLYPGYLWQVGMQQDLVFIQNMSLNKAMGERLPLCEFDVDGKTLMRLGGSILERHYMKRGKRNEADFRGLKRDIQYNAIPEM